MGIGQIGGYATLLDIDLEETVNFLGVKAEIYEANYVVHFLSHAMLFCAGALIEDRVIITPASCIYGETTQFEIFGGTHLFKRGFGAYRKAHNYALHRDYNHSSRDHGPLCVHMIHNIGIITLEKPYSFDEIEEPSDYIITRLRYGTPESSDPNPNKNIKCRTYGWGSRRNGYLIPMLLNLRRHDLEMLENHQCLLEYRWPDQCKTYLCFKHPECKASDYGQLCPDDLGTIVECNGFARGMMVSSLLDRPCGMGYLDFKPYNKFLQCAVDDAREIMRSPFENLFTFTVPK